MPTAKPTLGEVLKEKLSKIGEVLDDLTTLDVTTLSGDIQQCIDTESGKYDLTKALSRLATSDTTLDGEIYVVATTHVSVDMDAIMFVKKDLTDDEKALVTAHQKAVGTAQEARNSFLHFAKSFITGSASE